ncbi:pentapeptide repeat-containing protein [Glycomyces buryatensis]|uniref:pentapeptide repeat-containing protein n=1 Tax=Glycomyces buryatensis TaxID=2570927 RepID=UPI0014562D8D|nr:pentapeptide repeat-containing protein [Glycomyces buryatensis]
MPLRLSLHVLLMVGLAGLAAVVLWDFFAARFPSPLPADLKVDVVRLVMYVIAGLGGVVALVIAYRRQRLGEAAATLELAADSREQTKAFNERFAAAAEQMSSDKAANRLAGVYAMASLADGWDQGRQTCINVLCAYMRLPYDPPEEAPDLDTSDAREDHQERRAERQVRRTVMDVIGERLRGYPVPGKTWHGHDFDFSGAVIDMGNLRQIKITGGLVDFRGAEFSSGRVNFNKAVFSGGLVDFDGAKFSGGLVDFRAAEVSRGEVSFVRAEFSSGEVSFFAAEFSGGLVYFYRAAFSGSQVDFGSTKFLGGTVDLRGPGEWSTPPMFDAFPEGRPAGLLLPDLATDQTPDA